MFIQQLPHLLKLITTRFGCINIICLYYRSGHVGLQTETMSSTTIKTTTTRKPKFLVFINLIIDVNMRSSWSIVLLQRNFRPDSSSNKLNVILFYRIQLFYIFIKYDEQLFINSKVNYELSAPILRFFFSEH